MASPFSANNDGPIDRSFYEFRPIDWPVVNGLNGRAVAEYTEILAKTPKDQFNSAIHQEGLDRGKLLECAEQIKTQSTERLKGIQMDASHDMMISDSGWKELEREANSKLEDLTDKIEILKKAIMPGVPPGGPVVSDEGGI